LSHSVAKVFESVAYLSQIAKIDFSDQITYHPAEFENDEFKSQLIQAGFVSSNEHQILGKGLIMLQACKRDVL
jgi:hypothetical protein